MKPTIVLVHGAFADGSSWDGVIERLQRQGYSVEAPAIALRGVGADSAYLESVVKQIDGPVLLVGHSYGGALISNAATKVDNVIGLVFVAAFAPDTDEILGDVAAESKDSILMTAQVQRTYPTGKDGETAPEFLIDPAKLRESIRRRHPGGAHKGHGRHPAPGCGRRVHRSIGTPSVEKLAVMGRGRDR
jgi:pimeloyl-ACP methyl ester carboxylesterase